MRAEAAKVGQKQQAAEAKAADVSLELLHDAPLGLHLPARAHGALPLAVPPAAAALGMALGALGLGGVERVWERGGADRPLPVSRPRGRLWRR